MNAFDRLHALLPKPRCITEGEGTLTLPYGSAVSLSFAEAEPLLSYLFKDIFVPAATDPSLTLRRGAEEDGAYRIVIDSTVSVSAGDYAGMAAALQTLAQLAVHDGQTVTFPCCTIEDAPFKAQRGIHFLLPPADLLDEFFRVLDAMAALKYNMIILEIGGGMELERHPEINTAWIRFCRDAREHPRGPQGLQASEAYWKDATHVEIGGSGVMSKADVRRIAEHCAMLGMEIVPEIQGLSHCYFLTVAHPEIAERPYENWPDSYCPSCEESYTLYFDVADELIEVLQPTRVSIGHDEVRVLGECPRCRHKSGHELLAYEINRLHAYYAERGIQVMMWGEMLMNFTSWKGAPTGGVGKPQTVDRYGRRYSLPATYKAAGMVPKDILMLDWYYSMASNTEQIVDGNGFEEIFGNFRGSLVANWDTRGRYHSVHGAEVSTWCTPNEYELTFNGWLYELVFSAQVLWREDYRDDRRMEFSHLTENYLPCLQQQLSGARGFDGTQDTLSALSVAEGEHKDITYRFGTLDAATATAVAAGGLTPLGEEACLAISGEADALVFFHATAQPPRKRITTWGFYDKTDRIPAKYAVDYEDGHCVTCSVEFAAPGHYGAAIGTKDSRLAYLRPSADGEMLADIDDANVVNEDKASLSPMMAAVDPWRGAAVYACRFAELDTPDGIRTVYAYEWKNPYPGHRITGVRFFNEPKSPLEAELYAVGLVK